MTREAYTISCAAVSITVSGVSGFFEQDTIRLTEQNRIRILNVIFFIFKYLLVDLKFQIQGFPVTIPEQKLCPRFTSE